MPSTLEHRPVGRQARRGDAEIQPPSGQVVEHGDAVGELGGVVIRQQEAARADADALGLQQRLGDQQIGRRMRLPRRGVVLADPGLGVAQLVEPAQRLEVPVVAGLQAALRRMRGHGEIAEFHGGSSFASLGQATPGGIAVAIGSRRNHIGAISQPGCNP